MTFQGTAGVSGKVTMIAIPSIDEAPTGWKLRNKMRRSFLSGWVKYHGAKAFTRLTGIPTLGYKLRLVHILPNNSRVDYGVVSYKVVTNAGVDYMVDAFVADPSTTSNNTAEIPERVGKFNYHALGIGITAEDVTDTDLVNELTAPDYTSGQRTAGNKSEGDTTNEYRTQATTQVAQAVAVTEHGILNLQSIGAGTLLDRSVFAVINLGANSFLQSTYDFTINAGS